VVSFGGKLTETSTGKSD